MKNEYEIGLAKFLNRYALLSGENLKKLTHDEVKMLFPNLKRCTFEKIKEDPSLIYDRKVLLVNDGHKVIPYYVPIVPELIEEYNDVSSEPVIRKEEKIKNSYDYVSMSNYELKKILNNKFNSRKNRLKAKKELEDRGVIMKKEMKRLKIKKENYYEEY